MAGAFFLWGVTMSDFNLRDGPDSASGAEQALEALVMTEDLIRDFLESQERRGLAEYTMQCYRQRIYRLYRELPPDKQLRANTLSEWRNAMYERGASRVKVEAAMVTANKFVEFCQREDLMSTVVKTEVVPMTRRDYFRLLDVARARGNERSYLLVRAFGAMGLETSQLALLTVEAVQKGEIFLHDRAIHIPDNFRTELLSYAESMGIERGEIFLSGRGTPLHRSNVSCEMKTLYRAAGFPESDRYPRQLRLLHANTRKNIVAALEPLVDVLQDMLLDADSIEEEIS